MSAEMQHGMKRHWRKSLFCLGLNFVILFPLVASWGSTLLCSSLHSWPALGPSITSFYSSWPSSPIHLTRLTSSVKHMAGYLCFFLLRELLVSSWWCSEQPRRNPPFHSNVTLAGNNQGSLYFWSALSLSSNYSTRIHSLMMANK